jgi:hypothetical protein
MFARFFQLLEEHSFEIPVNCLTVGVSKSDGLQLMPRSFALTFAYQMYFTAIFDN